MKKFISVALATAMIASLGVTAFAKSNDYEGDVKNIEFADGLFGKTNQDKDELHFVLVHGKSIIMDDGASADAALDTAVSNAKKQIAKYTQKSFEYREAHEVLKDSGFMNADLINSMLDEYNEANEEANETDLAFATMTAQDFDALAAWVVENVDDLMPKPNDDNGENWNEDEIAALDTVLGIAIPAIQKQIKVDKDGKVTSNISANDVVSAFKDTAEDVKAVWDDAEDQIKTAEEVLKIAEADRAANSFIDYDEIEDIDDLKVTIKFTDGEEYVADYYIDEIDDAGNALDGFYAVIIELEDNYTTSKQKIKGEITLKNKTKKLEEKDFSYNHRVNKLVIEGDTGYDNYNDGTYEVAELEFDTEDVYINLVELNDISNPVVDFSKDVENIELEDDNGFYFDVKASDQGKLNLTYDNVAIKSVARVAPADADLSFFNFYGYPQFDFTGKVTLTPEEDDVEYFVYSVSKDGKISKINAKLNEDGDAYEFKTRTLGCYVLSDMELPVDEINEEAPAVDAPVADDAVVAPEVEDGKTNPGTGC